MTMLLITKELAEAVVESWRHDCDFAPACIHCEALAYMNTSFAFVAAHTPECIVTRAKLLLEQEWGIKS